ncbi:MAG: TatD family hydrolase, partial [Parasporobacterium sp.]|nr:TatD family hydrolase [Parasporobacterium sp.]
MDFDNLIFDSHAHYDDKVFDEDRDELFKSFPEKGVGFVLNASARADEVPGVLKLAEKYDFVYASVGVHPSEVYELWEDGDELSAVAEE